MDKATDLEKLHCIPTTDQILHVLLKAPMVPIPTDDSGAVVKEEIERVKEPVVGCNWSCTKTHRRLNGRGLEYIAEYVDPEGEYQPGYLCTLCELRLAVDHVPKHVVQRKHRLKFIEVAHPSQFTVLMIANKTTCRGNEAKLDDLVRRYAQEIETRDTRGAIQLRIHPPAAFRQEVFAMHKKLTTLSVPPVTSTATNSAVAALQAALLHMQQDAFVGASTAVAGPSNADFLPDPDEMDLSGGDNGSSGGSKPDRKCTTCGKLGHHASLCPKHPLAKYRRNDCPYFPRPRMISDERRRGRRCSPSSQSHLRPQPGDKLRLSPRSRSSSVERRAMDVDLPIGRPVSRSPSPSLQKRPVFPRYSDPIAPMALERQHLLSAAAAVPPEPGIRKPDFFYSERAERQHWLSQRMKDIPPECERNIDVGYFSERALRFDAIVAGRSDSERRIYFSLRHPQAMMSVFTSGMGHRWGSFYGDWTPLVMRRMQDKFGFAIEHIRWLQQELGRLNIPLYRPVRSKDLAPLGTDVESAVLNELVDQILMPRWEYTNLTDFPFFDYAHHRQNFSVPPFEFPRFEVTVYGDQQADTRANTTHNAGPAFVDLASDDSEQDQPAANADKDAAHATTGRRTEDTAPAGASVDGYTQQVILHTLIDQIIAKARQQTPHSQNAVLQMLLGFDNSRALLYQLVTEQSSTLQLLVNLLREPNLQVPASMLEQLQRTLKEYGDAAAAIRVNKDRKKGEEGALKDRDKGKAPAAKQSILLEESLVRNDRSATSRRTEGAETVDGGGD